jgi:hypothetical protein
MSNVRLASNAEQTGSLTSISTARAITSSALEFGMAEAVRLFRGLCGGLKW